jgi:cellulose synthase/poly-beta-1,6-N-acetylglucosamine synthase-like glycosyltransferase
MAFLFYSSVFTLCYIYFGYPLALYIASLVVTNTKAKSIENLPRISILIPAYNEQTYIKETVLNKLASNYPPELLELIVISDESTDETDAIVQAIAKQDSRVSLLRQEPRKGKTAAINRAVEISSGELLIFSDANSMYTDTTISALVHTFADENIGYVTGKMVYVDSTGSLVGDGNSAYMRYENKIRELEAKVGSVVGVDGGVDAMRKSLYQPLNENLLPDFVQPLKCVEQGYKVAFNEKALLQEESLKTEANESAMRVRVSLRAFWAMWDMRHLFNPFKYGLFSWQLLSHKLLRYLAIVFMIIALGSNAALALKSSYWLAVLLCQFGFYGLACWGAKKPNAAPAVARLAYYFCLINSAAGIALIKFLQGKKIVTWKPRKG